MTKRSGISKKGWLGQWSGVAEGLTVHDREQDLQRQVTLTRTQLKELRVSNESNQAKLLDHTQRQGEILPNSQITLMLTFWYARRPRSSHETRRGGHDGS